MMSVWIGTVEGQHLLSSQFKGIKLLFDMGCSVGLQELSLWPLLKSLFAELMGTAMLVIVGCGAALNWKTSFDVTQVS